jgi:hypothetical protein
MIVLAVSVLMATIALDVCWAKYTLSMTGKRPLASANWSAAIVALGAFTTVSYVEHHWIAIPALIGAWIGTYFTVKHHD